MRDVSRPTVNDGQKKGPRRALRVSHAPLTVGRLGLAPVKDHEPVQAASGEVVEVDVDLSNRLRDANARAGFNAVDGIHARPSLLPPNEGDVPPQDRQRDGPEVVDQAQGRRNASPTPVSDNECHNPPSLPATRGAKDAVDVTRRTNSHAMALEPCGNQGRVGSSDHIKSPVVWREDRTDAEPTPSRRSTSTACLLSLPLAAPLAVCRPWLSPAGQVSPPL